MRQVFLFIIILSMIFLFIQCDGSGNASDPAEELYGKTWQTNCLAPSGPGSYQFFMTFSSGGGFHRIENYYEGSDCTTPAAGSPVTIEKSFAWVEKTIDPDIKKLTYIDENDDTVYVLYEISGDTLQFAENDSVYPTDLTDAVDFE